MAICVMNGIMDISKSVRSFQRFISNKTIFLIRISVNRYNVPQLDISQKNSNHCLTPRESISYNWQLKQVALTIYLSAILEIPHV